MPSWNWNESQSESGVVHQSVANTDHNDASILKQGYDYANFSEITPTPDAAYPLDEDTGTTCYDLSGNNHDGTINGATVNATGDLGTSGYSLDGQDDYVDFGNPSVGDGTSQATITAFFRVDNTSNEFHAYSTGFDGTNLFRMYVDNSGNNVHLKNQAGEEVTVAFPGTGTWIFASGSYDSGSYNLLVNGTTASNSDGTSSLTDSGRTHTIGALDNQGTIERYGDGIVGFVWVYNTALSISQHETLYDVLNTAGTWTGTQKTL